MTYMLDTDICIYIIKEKPEKVLKKFKTLPIGDVAISAMTLSELHYGVCKSQHKKKNTDALTQFLIPLEILPFDDNAAYHYGDIRATLEKKGQPIGAMDFLIAAHARSLGLTLVTNNQKEFKRIDQLTIANWC